MRARARTKIHGRNLRVLRPALWVAIAATVAAACGGGASAPADPATESAAADRAVRATESAVSDTPCQPPAFDVSGAWAGHYDRLTPWTIRLVQRDAEVTGENGSRWGGTICGHKVAGQWQTKGFSPEPFEFSISPDGCKLKGTFRWAGGTEGTVSARRKDGCAPAFGEPKDAVASRADAPASPAPPTPKATPPQTAAAPASYSVKLQRGAPQPNAFALVVGIEAYRDLPTPTGARRDAERFAELAKESLGVPPDHVIFLADDRANRADIDKHVGWLSANASADARIYFFFAGHGAPDTATSSAYLLPRDGDPKFLPATALLVDDVLDKLSSGQAKEVIAFVDACFSGAGGRSVLPPGARALVRVVEPRIAPKGGKTRLALFSAAQATEISGPLPGQPVGLFTHQIVVALGTGAADINGDANVSLHEIGEWIPPRVAREAKKDNRDQTPVLKLSPGFGDGKQLWLSAGLVAR